MDSRKMQSSATDKLLVAAIDFGTTYSGYAFSFRHDFETNPLQICTNTSWIPGQGTGLASWKTPTTVLLNPDKTFHSFGYDAEEAYMELAENHEDKDYYYFHRFKMSLHSKKDLRRDKTIEAANGKSMPAKVVFTHAIHFIKNHLVDMIKNKGIYFVEEEILWILTVPAIWNEPAKQFMREAAIDAGINGDQLRLALEPEAASVYCKYAPLERSEESTNLIPFSPGTKYMVLDCGGGTVDVTVHEVLEDGTLKELHKASGGAWGGTVVDASYFSLFEGLFSPEVMARFKTELRLEHLEMERSFEVKKRSCKDKNRKVVLQMPVVLKDLIKEMKRMSAEECLEASRKQSQIVITRDRITLQGEIMMELFQTSVKSIIEHVNDVLKNPRVMGLQKILLVGGFSESPMVRDAVKAAFPELSVVVPHDPGLAVLKGAVIYGHTPCIISSRVMKYTYGIAKMVNFDPGVHPEALKKCIGDREFCYNVFGKFVGAGEDFGGEDSINQEYSISDPLAPLGIEVFASSCENPKYVTDQDCFKLGQIVVRAPPGGWPEGTQLRVQFAFGGTEFKVSAVDTHTNKHHEVFFDCLGD